MQTFEELSDIFSDHNNYLTSRELLMRVSPRKILENMPCHSLVGISKTDTFLFLFFLFALQEGTSKFASLESCAKEHQKRTHKRLQLQREMVRERPAKLNLRQIDFFFFFTVLYNLKQHIPPKQRTVK